MFAAIGVIRKCESTLAPRRRTVHVTETVVVVFWEGMRPLRTTGDAAGGPKGGTLGRSSREPRCPFGRACQMSAPPAPETVSTEATLAFFELLDTDREVSVVFAPA